MWPLWHADVSATSSAPKSCNTQGGAWATAPDRQGGQSTEQELLQEHPTGWLLCPALLETAWEGFSWRFKHQVTSAWVLVRAKAWGCLCWQPELLWTDTVQVESESSSCFGISSLFSWANALQPECSRSFAVQEYLIQPLFALSNPSLPYSTPIYLIQPLFASSNHYFCLIQPLFALSSPYFCLIQPPLPLWNGADKPLNNKINKILLLSFSVPRIYNQKMCFAEKVSVCWI